MKVIIPMAGLGSRFSSMGYDMPKPFIPFLGKPMIQHVVEHLGLQHLEHIFLCQKSHIVPYDAMNLFSQIVDYHSIVPIHGLTDGAATTVSKAAIAIDPDESVIIVNSDQLIRWDKNTRFNAGGTIYCFNGSGPNWSYAAIDENRMVTKVAEKVQISNYATAGMYHWKRFGDYLKAYNKMVAANDRTNNEFYVAPVYNYALDKGITIRMVDHIDQVGTPEELQEYLTKCEQQ